MKAYIFGEIDESLMSQIEKGKEWLCICTFTITVFNVEA